MQRIIPLLVILSCWLAWTSGCIQGNECRSAEDCAGNQTCKVGICQASSESGINKEAVPPEPTPEYVPDREYPPESCTVLDAGAFPSSTCTLPSETGPDTIPTTPTTVWAVQAGGTGKDTVHATKRDTNGNIYIAGTFEGTGTFGSFPLTSKGGLDAFVAKLDSQGKFLWAMQLGGTAHETLEGLVLDALGNAYVTGSFRSQTITIASKTLYLTGNMNTFVAKIDPMGKPLWGTASSNDAALKTPNIEEPPGKIVLAPNGNLLLAGAFLSNKATFGTTTLQRDGFRAGFVAAMDTKGKFLWATKLSAKDQGQGQSLVKGELSVEHISVATNGDIYAGGYFIGDWTFGGKTYKSNGTDAFVAKLTATGSLVWIEHIQGTGNEELVHIALDPSGTSLVLGLQYTGTLIIECQKLATATMIDASLAKFDLTTRRYLWVRVLQSPGNLIMRGHHNAANKNMYSTGYFDGGIMCANGKLGLSKTPGGHEGFIVKWDSTGQPLWNMRFGSTGDDDGSQILTGSAGELFITGNFEGTVDFKGTKLTSKGAQDIFIWKLKE